MSLLYYHVIALLAGFVLDAILGDPHSFPHPVRLMGALISALENHFLGPKEEKPKADESQGESLEDSEETVEKAAEAEEKTESAETEKKESLTEAKREKRREQGRLTVLIVLLSTVLLTDIFFLGSYFLHPIVGCIMETIMVYQALAAKSLMVESMKVYDALKTGSIEEARKAVSMIVGRDTAELDEAGVTRAAVETIAENTSDGIIAPMLYLAIGGPILGFLYKAINTMDSMIGYKNERYIDFGRAAAKLDDVVNYLPSRISAWIMILACHIAGDDYIASEAKRIYLRDRMKHASPNSAQTESACAGALGIKLGGDSTYGGKLVHKPELGDGRRRIDVEDIRRANHLTYVTAIMGQLICAGTVFLVVYLVTEGLLRLIL